ncbi:MULTISPECIES: aldehyde dehydrogenase family protein [unclassified Roseitalea]|nr:MULTISPECIES: aldehyde dehydrogenase family protein [unclassified Roseitalea]
MSQAKARSVIDDLESGHRIGGAVVAGRGPARRIEDPGTLNAIGEVADATADDVDRAVVAARAALGGAWRTARPVQRSRILANAARRLAESADRFALVESLNVGKPLRQARSDVATAARFLEYYAGAADKLEGETIPLAHDRYALVQREPVGVTAHIVPWNAPLTMLVRGVAPALAAGCTAVVKPAEATPFSALMFADLMAEAGLPAGVVNVVTGCGPQAGAALASHSQVDHVTFTGSVETGKAVMAMAAMHLATVTLELGGKSPLVVLEDGELDSAVDGIMRGIFTNAGQICAASSRLIVQDSVLDAVLERLVEGSAALSIGYGLNDPDIGPLISARQLDGVADAVGRARAEGAQVILGGSAAAVDGYRGHFFKPTIALVAPDSDLAQREIFGPVLAVMSVRDLDEAIAVANNSRYGLVAGVYTRDIASAMRFARDVEAGQVFVNRYLAGGVETPVGGVKNSGIGREKGLRGLDAYLRAKCTTMSWTG